MKVHRFLEQYLNVYGQARPITPEAREKKAPLSGFQENPENSLTNVLLHTV